MISIFNPIFALAPKIHYRSVQNLFELQGLLFFQLIIVFVKHQKILTNQNPNMFKSPAKVYIWKGSDFPLKKALNG